MGSLVIPWEAFPEDLLPSVLSHPLLGKCPPPSLPPSSGGRERGALPPCVSSRPTCLGEVLPQSRGDSRVWATRPAHVRGVDGGSRLCCRLPIPVVIFTLWPSFVWSSVSFPPGFLLCPHTRRRNLRGNGLFPTAGTSFCADWGTLVRVEGGYFSPVFQGTLIYRLFLAITCPPCPLFSSHISPSLDFSTAWIMYPKKSQGQGALLVPQNINLKIFVEKAFFREPLTWPLWPALSAPRESDRSPRPAASQSLHLPRENPGPGALPPPRHGWGHLCGSLSN